VTLWPQDFPLLAWVLIIAAFALFLFTTLFGRIWCGYSCPQTVWTSIFMWMEQRAEGSRNQRIKLDQKPMSAEKVWRKSFKHAMWISLSLLTAVSFVGYFTPIKTLLPDFFSLSAGGWSYFWIGFFTLATYVNAGWLREQICMYMCPYARFQGAMFDPNTLIVSYDRNRGEHRGARKKGIDPATENLGDCVDCQLCVQVCPTGIDIRDGLQANCIGCALCIDACDSIMDKMNYPRGLVSYTTENKLAGKGEHIIRPKSVGYALAVVLMIVAFSSKLIFRMPLELDIARERGQLYKETQSGQIENNYQLKVLNMDQQSHQYQITVSGLDNLRLIGKDSVTIDAGGITTLNISLAMNKADIVAANRPIMFHVQSSDNKDLSVQQESRFLAPAPKR
jgi:cytochrome c oxidase accessory protein FixG